MRRQQSILSRRSLEGSGYGRLSIDPSFGANLNSLERLTAGGIFTTAEITKLFSVIKDKRDRAVFLISYRHGLRISEVGLLTTNDVDFQNGRIAIHRMKGSTSGWHWLQPDESTLLKDYLDSRKKASTTLFLSRNNNPVNRRTLDGQIREFGKQAKLPPSKTHFHVLRHSVAVHLLDRGAPLEAVRDWMGHKSIASTLPYLKLACSRPIPSLREYLSKLPAFDAE